MEFKVTKEFEGMTIKDYLQQVHSFSRRILKSIKLDGGAIYVNNIKQTVRYRLKVGDSLTVHLPPETIGLRMEPIQMPLTIKYEDEDIFILDKPANIATIPSQKHPINTIANGVLAYYKEQNLPYTVHVVTRLDKDTSGLVLIAKHRYSHSILDRVIKEGKIKRKYTAIVHGHLKNRTGIIDAPIGRKTDSIIEREVRKDGKEAVTHYQVIQQFANYAMVEIELQTGRTHQIRVHFSYIGHPLIGDDLYGMKSNIITRQALHASHLCFDHPFKEKRIAIESNIPQDMKQLL